MRLERRRDHEHKREIWRQRLEAFRLENEPGVLPDFVVIGAQKSGTGRFYGLLTRHPNVKRAAVKEVHYFDNHFDEGIEWYRRCFPPPALKNGRKSITGEATPKYLFDPLVPERMAEVVPEARLIALLRNPVDRAYSHYHMAVRKGRESRSFEEAIEERQAWLLGGEDELSEHERRSGVDHRHPDEYLRRGFYVDQLLRWRGFFDDGQMLVIKAEDFFKHPWESLRLVQDFLGLPYRKPDLQPHSTEHSYEPMNPVTRRWLEDFFEPHNRRLYEHLGVDFGW